MSLSPPSLDARPTTDGKVAAVVTWTVVWGIVLVIALIPNIYVFGQIDFPEDSSVAGPYRVAGWLTVYGGSLLALPVAFWFVKRNAAWSRLIALLAVPIVVQFIWVLLFAVLTQVYGYVSLGAGPSGLL